MHIVRRGVAAVGIGALAATALIGAPSTASAAPRIPVVAVHINKNLTLSTHHLRAGRVVFAVYTGKGAHDALVARIHAGYSFAQASQDIGKGFGGDAAAIRRVDKNVTFLGGAPTRAGAPGRFGITIPAGHYVVVDQDSGAHTTLTVTGSIVKRPALKTSGSITLLTYGFATRGTLPRSGALHIADISDQPHFLEMQHIKKGVTRQQLKKAFAGESRPNFILPGSTESGVLSPYRAQSLNYSLPAGRYVIACFWPDSKTGMVHAAMGMFRQITLK